MDGSFSPQRLAWRRQLGDDLVLIRFWMKKEGAWPQVVPKANCWHRVASHGGCPQPGRGSVAPVSSTPVAGGSRENLVNM